MNVQPRTLEQLHNRPTCYEVAVNDVVVAYVARRTRSMLYDIVRRNADYIRPMVDNIDADIRDLKAGARFVGILVGGNVRVVYTGRTERDARMGLEP